MEAGARVTGDGSVTLWSERYGEHFHDRHGAATQSRVVFLEGSATNGHEHPRVLEIGFGVGRNFLTTLADVRLRGVPLHYRALDIDPQPAATLAALAGPAAALDPLWQALLARWGAPSLDLTDADVRMEFSAADASQARFAPGWASAIYLDGFSPAHNPELWTSDFLGRLATALAPGGRIATYSAAGHVRRALAAAGLSVERRTGLVGKREFLVAAKPR